MDPLKLLKVANRMLFDLITVLEKKETDYEIGCKCKNTEIAKALRSMLAVALHDISCKVLIKEDVIVVITPSPSSVSVPESSPCVPSLPQSPLPDETSSPQPSSPISGTSASSWAYA